MNSIVYSQIPVYDLVHVPQWRVHRSCMFISLTLEKQKAELHFHPDATDFHPLLSIIGWQRLWLAIGLLQCILIKIFKTNY